MLFPAPAKLNLTLRILGQRADGFHEISTLMAPLTLTDQLHFSLEGPSGVIAFTCSDAAIPCDEANLVVKAAQLLQSHHGPFPGVKIHLDKKIPHGAGLGGGSSDAATTLRALNEIFQLKLSASTLQEHAAILGSDVPFFLNERLAQCTGRGEIVTPMDALPLHWPVLLIKLPFAVPTPWAYRQWRDSEEIPGIDYGPQAVETISLVNDLERPVFEKHFVLATLKHWLRQQPSVRAALMSGSGSTVFAILKDPIPCPELLSGIRELVGEEVTLIPTQLAV